MAEGKIPVLTEVYQPKSEAKFSRKEDPTLGVTPELIARVAAHVRPRLEEEIRESVLSSLREVLSEDIDKELANKLQVEIKKIQLEIKKTQETIVESTSDFVDKTKADLKTDLPAMYQASADLVHETLRTKFSTLQNEVSSKLDTTLADKVQSALEGATTEIQAHTQALQVDASAHMMQHLNAEMGKFKDKLLDENSAQFTDSMRIFQENLLVNHQTQLEQAMSSALQVVNQRILESTQEQEDIMQTQVGSIQQETLAQLRTTLHEEKTEIYDATMAEIKTHFTEQMTAQTMQLRNQFLATINADLPAVQEVLKDNVEHMLAEVMPALEGDLRKQLTAELRELLVKVKFVLPN